MHLRMAEALLPGGRRNGCWIVHDNILCYRKTDGFAASLLPMTEAQRGRYKNPDKDPNGAWKPADYTCRFTAKERPNLYYPIINPNTGKKVWPKKTARLGVFNQGA